MAEVLKELCKHFEKMETQVGDDVKTLFVPDKKDESFKCTVTAADGW